MNHEFFARHRYLLSPFQRQFASHESLPSIYGSAPHLDCHARRTVYLGASIEISPKRLQELLAFLSDVYVLDYAANEARRFGEIRAGLLDQGLPAPNMDLLIAATAIHAGLTLVTHNTSDYANVPGLNLADWMMP